MTISRSSAAAAVLAAVLAAAGCGASSSAPAVPAATRPPSPAPAPAATPDTGAAARSAAAALFALYAAGDYPAVYPRLSASVRAIVRQPKWVAVHQKCYGSQQNLSYKIGKPVLAGDTAVISVSVAGVASSLGSEEETFVYQDGGWYWQEPATDLATAGGYRGTVARVVARLKAGGHCG
jgi:hypothetical protein